MPDKILIYYFADIFFNSIIAFGASALAVESFIFILHMKKRKMFKTMYFMRLLPFIKIIYDILFIFNPVSWALANGIDIINRPFQSMAFHFGAEGFIPFIFFDFSIYNLYTVSLGDLITQHISFYYTIIIVISILTGSLFFIIFNSIKLLYSTVAVKFLVSGSRPAKRKIGNEELAGRLKSRDIKIWISPEKGFSPFSYGVINPGIVIPANFYKKLTLGEYEALIAHEIGHIGWGNTLAQFLLLFMKSFFWFIPFIHNYIRNIYIARELFCDKNCMDFKYNSFVLAELLKKAAFYVRAREFSFASTLYSDSSPLLLRVMTLLDNSINGNTVNEQNSLYKFLSRMLILILSFLISIIILKSRLGII